MPFYNSSGAIHPTPDVNPRRKRSEGETAADRRCNVGVVLIGNAGAMRNGDGQTALHVGNSNSRKPVETRGEAMVHIERVLVESAGAGSAETGFGRAGRGNTKV